MKYDLAIKSKESANLNEAVPSTLGMGKDAEKDKGPRYPCANVYNLPDGVKDVKVGDTLTIEAQVKSLSINEEGVSNMEVEFHSMEDGKKEVLTKKKKISDADIIDKAVDEEADKKETDEDDE